MRLILLALMFLAFIVTGPALVVAWVLPELPLLLGLDPAAPVAGWHALAVAAVGVPLVFAALYGSGLLWLISACCLFRREEVERLAHAGPRSRLERWLFERLCP